MADNDEFIKRIALRVKQVQDNAAKIVRKAALAIDQVLVTETPVDTGRARSNWLVSVNTPRQDTVEPYSPGRGGSTAGDNVNSALEQANQAIAGYKPGDAGIFIANNLPYIGDLNAGTSAQAPANFIENAIATAVKSVSGAKLMEG